MPAPNAIIDMAASLMNDTAQTLYTDTACLPYLNMALDELQELFELNNIPVTDETSAILNVTAGTATIGSGTTPALPTNLIEVRNLWESQEGLARYSPVIKKDFLPKNFVSSSTFGVYAWMEGEIRLIAANADIDLKLDYIQSIFATPILIGAIATDLPIRNIKSYLGYKTAALCSLFIGENESRAMALDAQAELALNRTLGISTKGRQSMPVKRRPFQEAWKLLR